MDQTKKIKLAKAEQIQHERRTQEIETQKGSLTVQFNEFVGELSDLLSRGIQIDGLSDLDRITRSVDEFGLTAQTLMSQIVMCLSAVDELTIPDTIRLDTVTDQKLLDTLEKIGDTHEITAKIQALDQAIILLTSAIETTAKKGKRPEDYQPVRLVEGTDLDLRFVSALPFGGSAGGGGSSNGLTDAQLRASPVPVSATLDTTGLATDTNQTTIIGHIDTLETLIGSTNTKLDTLTSTLQTVTTKATDAYSICAISEDSTYKYFFFEDATLNYYVMRKHKTNQTFDYTRGTGGYATVYVNSTSAPSGSPVYASYGNTF